MQCLYFSAFMLYALTSACLIKKNNTSTTCIYNVQWSKFAIAIAIAIATLSASGEAQPSRRRKEVGTQ